MEMNCIENDHYIQHEKRDRYKQIECFQKSITNFEKSLSIRNDGQA